MSHPAQHLGYVSRESSGGGGLPRRGLLLDGHDEIKNTDVCGGDKVCSVEGPDLLIEAGEFLRNVTDEDSNGQTEPAAEQKAEDDAAAQKNTAQQQNNSQDPQVQHKTLVGAGIAAERKYNPTSIKQDKEYAGWIEKTKNGKYVVDPAHPGTQAGSDPGPRPKNAAGEYHTHGGNDPGYDNEHFSNHDKWFLHNNHVHGFLGTPGHTIQEYDPATGKVIIFKERTD